jgi:hypothetical protein
VFRGVGRIVEIPNLPADPDNVSRDDLVFPSGTMPWSARPWHAEPLFGPGQSATPAGPRGRHIGGNARSQR